MYVCGAWTQGAGLQDCSQVSQPASKSNKEESTSNGWMDYLCELRVRAVSTVSAIELGSGAACAGSMLGVWSRPGASLITEEELTFLLSSARHASCC